MKTIKLFLAFMAFIAVKTNAQQIVVANSPAENYTVNAVTSTKVSVPVNATVIISNDIQSGSDAERTKNFSKTFSVDNGDKVSLNNQYGAMVIKTWDRKEVKVDVEIKAYSNSDSDVQKLIDEVSIDANKTGDQVSVKTNMGDRNGNFGRRSNNGVTTWRREVKVNYTVYMPAANALTAQQQYGSIDLADFSGPTSLKVQYGNLTTGNLNNANNYINVQYGKTNLKDVNKANIKNQYGGGLTLASINDLELDAQYTSVNIGSIKNNANIKHQYGRGVNIGYAGSLNLTIQYANVKVDKLGGIFTGKFQYGKLDIGNIETGCKVFNVDGEYTSIALGFSPSFNADFNINTKYGGFKYGENVTAKKLGDERGYSSSKSYSGEIGKGGTTNVNIKTEYGSVTFK